MAEILKDAQSPDETAAGFLQKPPEATRYEHLSLDTDDVGLKLAALIPPKAEVLDVGCGTGVITEILRQRTGASIVGIEPDEERARFARGRGLNVHCGYLTPDFVRQHGPFDFAVFADVLEHLANPAELVGIAKGGLKPGGSILASVPNVAHWFVRTDLLRGRFDYQDCGIMDATHLRWFTRRTIREFFERLGFQITATDFTVNIDLPDYQGRIPWRWMAPAIRKQVAGTLTKWAPELFGCQHIIRATLPK